jgi:Family of unknown function (DUF6155)
MAKNNSSLTVVKAHLKNCSKEELIADITELFKRFQPVQDYYQVKISPQAATNIDKKYKKIIEDEFFPARGYGDAKLSVAKKAISDYRKICTKAEEVADIMLFYVEQGVKYTNAYGDINESFYNSMEGMYEKAIQWIFKYKIQDIFAERCQKIMEDSSGIGWGFSDAMCGIYEEAFEGEEE